MKHFISVFIIIISSSMLFAKVTTLNTKPFKIQAGYGEYMEVNVNRIPAQVDGSFNIGMPFNIEDDYVLYKPLAGATPDEAVFGAGSGRIIAEWNIISNTFFEIQISVEPKGLKSASVSTKTGENVILPFSLAFECDLAYYTSDSNRDSKQMYFIYDGNSEATYIWDYETGTVYPEFGENLSNNYVGIKQVIPSAKDNNFIGSASGKIYFGFTETATNKIKNDSENVPAGNYTAEVTVLIRTEGV